MTATDEQLLLRAVYATPGDDLPRLVYADWLEERADDPCGRFEDYRNCISAQCKHCSGTGRKQGRRERAEFIRVQCELARLEAVVAEQRNNAIMGGCCERFANQQACDCPSGPEVDALRRRERELWLNNVDRWFGKPPPHYLLTPPNEAEERNGHTVCVLHRGFPAVARLTLAVLLGEPCDVAWCYGGEIRTGEPQAPWDDCPRCSGTGRVGGCAAELVVACPTLERVELAGVRPWRIRRSPERWTFGRDNGPSTEYLTEPDQRLPGPLFDVYEGMTGGRGQPTQAAALDALSAACLAHARTQAVARGLVPKDLFPVSPTEEAARP